MHRYAPSGASNRLDATNLACANQVFNLTNGDYFHWENMWPIFVHYFGLDLGPVRTIRLVEVMPSKIEGRNAIVAARGLVQSPYDGMVSLIVILTSPWVGT